MADTPTPNIHPVEGEWAKPVGTLTVGAISHDAVNLNVQGRRVTSPLQGFGQLWQKTYKIRLAGAVVTPQQVIQVWKEHFPEFWPQGNRFYGGQGPIHAIDGYTQDVDGLSFGLTGSLKVHYDWRTYLPTGAIAMKTTAAGGTAIHQIAFQVRFYDPNRPEEVWYIDEIQLTLRRIANSAPAGSDSLRVWIEGDYSGVPNSVPAFAAIDPEVDLTLTTNGAGLARKAKELKDAGLKRVTVSLDSLDDATFRAMNDVDFPVDKVLEGIDAAAAAGLAPIKINMVVKRGMNDGSIVAMARRFRGSGHVVRFIEFMDVGATNGWRMDDVVPAAEIVRTIGAQMPLVPADPNYEGEVAERWRYADGGGEKSQAFSRLEPSPPELMDADPAGEEPEGRAERREAAGHREHAPPRQPRLPQPASHPTWAS